MRRVGGHEVLLGCERAGVSRLEERTGELTIAARPPDPSSLEVEACTRDVALRELCRLVGNGVGALECAAQPLHACQLRQNLGAAVVRLLGVELCSEALLRRVEIVDVPQPPQTIVHGRVA